MSEEAKGPRKYSKKAVASVGVLAIAAVLAGYGVRWWMAGRFIEQTDDAYVGGNVTVIAPHVSGYVAAVLVEDNQLVMRGEPLVRLESKDFRALLDAATAHVTERKAALSRLKAQRELEALLIRQAHAVLAAKTAAAEFKASEAARYEKLVLADASTRQSAERWRSESHEARAEADAVEAGLGAARQKPGRDSSRRAVRAISRLLTSDLHRTTRHGSASAQALAGLARCASLSSGPQCFFP